MVGKALPYLEQHEANGGGVITLTPAVLRYVLENEPQVVKAATLAKLRVDVTLTYMH